MLDMDLRTRFIWVVQTLVLGRLINGTLALPHGIDGSREVAEIVEAATRVTEQQFNQMPKFRNGQVDLLNAATELIDVRYGALKPIPAWLQVRCCEGS